MESETKAIQVAATLDGVSSLRDGGLSVRFHTQELDQTEKAVVMGQVQQYGWLLFQPNQDIEIPKGRAPESELGKTPSQRLRAVIYVKFQQADLNDLTFDEYYRRELERLITYEKTFLKEA